MPGPYCSFDDVVAQAKARLAQAGAVALPEHWDELCRKAPRAGYSRMVGLLAGRGYSLSLIDIWDGRSDYNLRYALAYAFAFGAFRRGDDTPSPNTELKRLDDELKDSAFLLIDETGGLLVPDITAAVGHNQIGYGRSTTFDKDACNFEAWGDGFDPTVTLGGEG